MSSQFKACAVSGCDKNAHYSARGAHGWCSVHYQRWKRHGDPHAGRALDGEAMNFYRNVVLSYDGDECLLWPYTKNPRGYGRIWHEGCLKTVSRLVCEDRWGPPPTPEHAAAHSCGNGHLGCCSKRHLSWKTTTANHADKIEHGTHYSTLTEEQVRQSVALKGTMTCAEIGSLFHVSSEAIRRIHNGSTWAWLTGIGAQHDADA